MKKQHGIYLETNYAFNNAMRYDISDQTTHWLTDSVYTSQVNYNYQTPCLLEVYPEKVTAVELKSGEAFKSVRTHELLMDSYDRERRGLAIRKMYRTVAPWTTENPIFMHLVSKNDEEVINAIDQCAATGYEALILSFGSHCNMEDSSAANVAKWKKLADYAHSQGILIGGYSLFSSRKISDEELLITNRRNHLHWLTINLSKGGAQRIMTPHQFVNTPPQRSPIERAVQPNTGRNVVGGGAGRQLIEEPHPFLRERQR